MKKNVSEKFFVSSLRNENQEEIDNFDILDPLSSDDYICNIYPKEFKNIEWQRLYMFEPISSTIAVDFKREDKALKKKYKTAPIKYFEEYAKLRNIYFQDFKHIRRSDNGQPIEPIDPISFVMHGVNGQKKINKTEIVEEIKKKKCNDFHHYHLVGLMNLGSNDKVNISEVLDITTQLLNEIENNYNQVKNQDQKSQIEYRIKRLNIINSGKSFEKTIKKILKEKEISYIKNGVCQLLPGEETLIDNSQGSIIKQINNIKNSRKASDAYPLLGHMQSRKDQYPPVLKNRRRDREIEINKWKEIINILKSDFKKSISIE